MVASMANYLRICHHHTILDFGSARGYIVKAFRELGYQAWGTDCSDWAVANADDAVKNYVYLGNGEINGNYDWIIAKDVLEHVVELPMVVNEMLHRAKVGIFVVIPLSPIDGDPYVCPAYEKDITHIHRFAMPTWAQLFMRPGWSVTCCYKMTWIKQAWYKPGWERGNGFITCKREE